MTDQINPRKEYSATDIRREKIFPWALHPQTIRNVIRGDVDGMNELGARIEGRGRQSRYVVKGSKLIKYIKKYGHAMRVHKQKHGSNHIKIKKGRGA